MRSMLIIAAGCGAAIFVVGSASMIGYAINLPGLYTWKIGGVVVTSMAPNTAVGFTLAGLALMLQSWALLPLERILHRD